MAEDAAPAPEPHLAEQPEGPADDTLLLHRDADLEVGGVEVDGTCATLDGGTMTLAEAEAENQGMNQIYAELEAGDISNRERLFELLRDKVTLPETYAALYCKIERLFVSPTAITVDGAKLFLLPDNSGVNDHPSYQLCHWYDI
jgi:hypothetical protein